MIQIAQVSDSGGDMAGEMNRPGKKSVGGTKRISEGRANAWLIELLIVDCWHGAAALVAYVVWVALFVWDFTLAADDSPGWLAAGWVMIGLVVPAVLVTRIFCTDFSHGTVERLLVLPVGRGKIWIARVALSGFMLFVPLMMGWGGVSLRGKGFDQLGESYSNLSFGVFVVWCAWCFGPLAAVLLRRAMLVFSVTLISPFGVMVLVALISGLTGFNQGMISISPTIPYIGPVLLALTLILGIISHFVAALLWRRMEVR